MGYNLRISKLFDNWWVVTSGKGGHALKAFNTKEKAQEWVKQARGERDKQTKKKREWLKKKRVIS